MPEDMGKVKIDGEDAILHITDQSVMFEKGGRVGGFERSAIRMVKPDGDAMIIAYSAGSEVKSVRVEPLIAVASLVASGSNKTPMQISTPNIDEIFEKLYVNTRRDLEDRLAKVEEDPTNKSLRLSQQELEKYIGIRNQMTSLVGTKYGVNPDGDELLTFWGLETQPLERQLDVVRIMHLHFLLYLASQKAETEDIGYQAYQVWPGDWPRILRRFNLGDAPYTTAMFNNYVDYLKSHWKYSPASKRPVLAST